MMAAGEIRLSTTMPRRMPVLAQSGAPNLSMAPSEDGTPALLSQGTAAQSQQGFGSNPGFAASSIDELSEIQVTAAAGYDQSALHNLIVAQMTAAFRKAGATVVNGPVLCLPGVTPCGQPDLLVGVGGAGAPAHAPLLLLGCLDHAPAELGQGRWIALDFY